jgi:citrate lyase gamma subunit
VGGQEGGYLAAYLEVGDVSIEVEPDDAGDVERHVAVEDLVDVDDGTAHRDHLR